jgi:hypothetical protein
MFCCAEDLDITAHVDVSLRLVDDISFFKVEAVRVDFSIGRLSLRLNNLYNGLKAFGTHQHRPGLSVEPTL